LIHTGIGRSLSGSLFSDDIIPANWAERVAELLDSLKEDYVDETDQSGAAGSGRGGAQKRLVDYTSRLKRGVLQRSLKNHTRADTCFYV
jgi:hypothetical protein